MKKLLNVLFLFFTVLIISCRKNNGSNIPAGVKVIGKSYKELSADDNKLDGVSKIDRETIIFPTLFWDTKSMIW